MYPCEAPGCNALKSQINTSRKLQKKPVLSSSFFTEAYDCHHAFFLHAGQCMSMSYLLGTWAPCCWWKYFHQPFRIQPFRIFQVLNYLQLTKRYCTYSQLNWKHTDRCCHSLPYQITVLNSSKVQLTCQILLHGKFSEPNTTLFLSEFQLEFRETAGSEHTPMSEYFQWIHQVLHLLSSHGLASSI